MAIDWHKAIIKSMRAYYAGQGPSELNKTSGKRAKYSKSYFDKVGREYNIEPFEPKKSKDKKRG